jgi:hypothetical protein
LEQGRSDCWKSVKMNTDFRALGRFGSWCWKELHKGSDVWNDLRWACDEGLEVWGKPRMESPQIIQDSRRRL